jgi:cysteinyl-tRNA synthetase
MAKSLGNYITLEDLVSKKYDPRGIRLALISTHYRHELNFTFDALDAAEKTVESLSAFVARLKEADGEDKTSVDELVESTKKRFEDALDDDLDIRGALTALFDLVGQVNKSLDEDNVGRKGAGRLLELVQGLDEVLNLQLGKAQTADLSEEAESLIAEREAARKNKDWATADKIRKQLEGMGVLLEDTSKGVRWKLAKKTD